MAWINSNASLSSVRRLLSRSERLIQLLYFRSRTLRRRFGENGRMQALDTNTTKNESSVYELVVGSVKKVSHSCN